MNFNYEAYKIKKYMEHEQEIRDAFFDRLNNDYLKGSLINNENIFKILHDEEHIGEIDYTILGQLNEFKLVKLKVILNDDDKQKHLKNIIREFIYYLVKEQNVLKLLYEVFDFEVFDIKILEESGFILSNTKIVNYLGKECNLLEYKITKKSFKYE